MGDDKELLAVDNNPSSPYYGNLYLVWTDFGAGGIPIRATRSTDGGVTWWAPVTLSSGGSVQGAWPAVAPNGDVFVAWLHYDSGSAISIQASRSVNGGLSYSPITSPLVGGVRPKDASASSLCGRDALNGQIRYIASPQIAVDSSGVLHVVYSHDPDGLNTGDVVDVYYRRSTDNGATWSPELRLNDDATTNDQYFPTIETRGSTVMATWYDRRLDPSNLLQDYYKRVSTDGGLTWGPSVRVSDVSSPIYQDPGTATCYHGDYDQSLLPVTVDLQVPQWADDRNVISGHQDSDVWVDPGGQPLSISDTFGGRGALDGRTTETGGATWTATPAAQIAYGRVIDLAALGGVPVAEFYPAGDTVTVKGKVDLTSTDWIGVGFADHATRAYWAAGQLWVLLRSTGTYEAYADGNSNLLGSGTIPGTPSGGYHQIEVRYDSAANTGTILINGVTVVSGAALGFTPDVQYAGFQMYRAAEGGGKLDDFLVSKASAPYQVISDSFTGTGSLDGRSTDVGGVVWSAEAGAWTTGGRVVDRAAVGGVPVDPAMLGAYPTLRVSADANPTSSDWVGVGLANQATTAYWAAGQLWALVRSTGTFEAYGGGSLLASGTIPGTPSGGFDHIEVRYDTVTLQAVVLVNGVQVYSGTLGSALSVSYAGFHMQRAAEGAGKLDNFLVVSTATP